MTAVLAAVIGVALLAAGCSGGDDEGTGDLTLTPGPSTASGLPTQSPTESAPTTVPTSSGPSTNPNDAYGLPLPKGVRLTPLGTTLTVGQPATVAWRPTTSLVGVLRITVTRLRQGDLADFGAFELDDATRASTPFYVDATVTNVGRSDLAAVSVPLVLVDGRGTLVRASRFQATFSPCSARPLPRPFRRGSSTPVCLVYLASDHGTLSSVAFRPVASYAAIRWTGTVLAPAVPAPVVTSPATAGS